jgi:hypothetical protein
LRPKNDTYLSAEEHFDVLQGGEGVRIGEGKVRLEAGVRGEGQQGGAGRQGVPRVALRARQEGRAVLALVPKERRGSLLEEAVVLILLAQTVLY